MITEAKKLHIIEEVLKINNDAVLMEIEAALDKNLREGRKKRSAHDFSGLLSEKDASLIDAAIEEGCEKIDPDDWK